MNYEKKFVHVEFNLVEMDIEEVGENY